MVALCVHAVRERCFFVFLVVNVVCGARFHCGPGRFGRDLDQARPPSNHHLGGAGANANFRRFLLRMPVWPKCCDCPSRLLFSLPQARAHLIQIHQIHGIGRVWRAPSRGKWAASAPSKGWERMHIANASRTGTFKRPGAGVAIRAPATQTLPPKLIPSWSE